MAAVFCGSLAVCNFGALASWAYQFEGLAGEDGIEPLKESVQTVRRSLAVDREVTEADVADCPSENIIVHKTVGGIITASSAVLWKYAPISWKRSFVWTMRRWAAVKVAPSIFTATGYSRRTVQATFAAGFLACFALLLSAVLPAYPPCFLAGPSALLFAAVYLSFTTYGSPWLALQFETLLIEANAWFGVLYCFSHPVWGSPSAWVWAMRGLAFRLMLGAGVGKIAGGDPAWRDGRAMKWHYETQPLPNPLSRSAHAASPAWHVWETRLTFAPEGLVPLLLFWGQPWKRLLGWTLTAAFNTVIALTGNYGHLHMLTVTLAWPLLIETDPLAMGLCAQPQGQGQGQGDTFFVRRLPPAQVGSLSHLAWSALARLCSTAYSLTSALVARVDREGSQLSAGLRAATGLLSRAAGVGAVAVAHAVAQYPPHVPCPPAPAAAASSVASSLPHMSPLAQGAALLLSWTLCVAAWCLLALYVALSTVPLARNFEGLLEVSVSPPGWRTARKWASKVQPWHLAGTYNLFAHMTRARWELQYELSADGGRSWYELSFPAKPGGPPCSLDARPPHLAPGHIPRLDWRLWFLPLTVQRLLKRGVAPDMIPSVLSTHSRGAWHRAFMQKLLAGSPSVLALLRFPPALRGYERGLTHVRCCVYSYHFSVGDTRRSAGETYGRGPSVTAPVTASGAYSSEESDSDSADSHDNDAGEAEEGEGADPGMHLYRSARCSDDRAKGTQGHAEGTGESPAGDTPTPVQDRVGLHPSDAPSPAHTARVYGEVEVGRVWSRQFVCVYDAISRPMSEAIQAASAAASSADIACVGSTHSAAHSGSTCSAGAATGRGARHRAGSGSGKWTTQSTDGTEQHRGEDTSSTGSGAPSQAQQAHTPPTASPSATATTRVPLPMHTAGVSVSQLVQPRLTQAQMRRIIMADLAEETF